VPSYATITLYDDIPQRLVSLSEFTFTNTSHGNKKDVFYNFSKACEAGAQTEPSSKGPEGGGRVFAARTTTHGSWFIHVHAAFMQLITGRAPDCTVLSKLIE